ncbi:hypothetical protein JCM8208_001732 [Rhodotorula glutinis]
MPALPSSTSESHLVRAHRAPPQPKPPAQPTKVRPFILRGTSATAPPPSAAPGRPADRAAAGTSTEGSGTGTLKKSKTSVDVAQHAEPARSDDSSRATDKEHRRRTAVVRSDFAMTPAGQHDGADGSRRLGLTRSPPLPSSSSSSVPRRPVSLAASSLRAISSSHTSTSSSRPSPTPRARPLSYVSSPTSPPPDSTSPPRRRPMSFSASPSPPTKLRPTPSSSSSRPTAPAKPVISPTRARALSPAASAAVEEHKAALKRRTLAARQRGGAESPTEGSAAAAGMRRSGRWFGRLASVASDDSATHDAQDENAPVSRSGSPLGARLPSAGLRVAQVQAQPPATPPHAVAGLRGPGKKASFTALGRGRAQAQPVHDASASRAGDDEVDPGFSSLQELLERHGYAETRVITPQAQKTRPVNLDTHPDELQVAPPRVPSPVPPTTAPSSSLAPPAQHTGGGKSLKERSSLLSLRGWFSLFSPTPESDSGEDDEDAVEILADPVVADGFETDSPQPRMRSASEVLHWVDGVNQEFPPPAPPLVSAPHPLSRSSLPIGLGSSLESTPQLLQYGARDDDTASARSYSSSLSLDYSPPTPHHPLPSSSAHATSFCPTIAISGDADSPTKPRHAGAGLGHSLVLRHAASDSHLLTTSSSSSAIPRYESFSGLGISLPTPAFDPLPPPMPHRVATPPPAPGAFSGVPSLLRERVSQLFSFSASPTFPSSSSSTSSTRPPSPFASPIDAATGLSPSQRRLLSAAHAHAHTLARERGRAPHLLRKAVSAGGLRVAALSQVTRAKVEAKSSRESLGSLEAAPVVEAASAGTAAEADLMASAWGEDLLGRRW